MCPTAKADARDLPGRKRMLFESRREREFYSYYESVLSHLNIEAKTCDLDNPDNMAAHQAVCSPDRVLTALTQLAALRLSARRAMLVFFDSDHHYILAESTRTLSLEDESRHQAGDSLWLGATQVPRGFSVCEHTVNLPTKKGSLASGADWKANAFIVNDLAQDTRFCNAPFVQDDPKARFYAGVPITTPSSINIGVLCVLDDSPRKGLESGEIHFLSETASTVMDHLDMIRAKTDNQRSHDMTTALGAFVEGKSASRDWWLRSAHSSFGTPQRLTTTQAALATQARIKTFSNRIPLSSSNSTTQHNAATLSVDPNDIRSTIPAPADEISASPSPNENPASGSQPGQNTKTSGKPEPRPGANLEDARGPSHGQNPQEDHFVTHVEAATRRAAGLIREALGADGVLFLDATIGSFGGLVSASQGLSQTETETEGSNASDVNDANGKKQSCGERPTHPVELSDPVNHSSILGAAFADDIGDRVINAMQHAKIAEKTLRAMLRRYPEGQIWHFNLEGDASDEDDMSDGALSTTSAGESAGSDAELGPAPSTKRALRRMRLRIRDGRKIQEIFPGVRSLVFLGMWDPHRERWFGASLALSYSPKRIFSIRNELNYIAAFCDVLLAEIWRLEAQMIGRSKSDFISSISHELRSPLHGILGSAECLEQQASNTVCQELVRSITSCGTTLLDIINDLLEYSRLNQGAQRSTTGPRQTGSRRSPAIASPSEPLMGDPLNTPSITMLDSVTEDAVATACLGFDHQGIASMISQGTGVGHHATIILDIEEAQSADWCFSIAGGSWKRICMNLVSNALKYTPSGYISITLRKKWVPRKAGRERIALVELTVQDSGIGISEAFQAQNLFRPFQQEDSLIPGTGLGLNLVAQIVKSQGGTVHVHSKKGTGTTVRVALPLQPMPTPIPTRPRMDLLPDPPSVVSVGFFGFGTLDVESSSESPILEARQRLAESLKICCRQLGLRVCVTDDTIDAKATLYIIHEAELGRWLCSPPENPLPHQSDNPRRPIIIICGSRTSAIAISSSDLASSVPEDAQYLWSPIGPGKLVAAISAGMHGSIEKRHGLATPEDDQFGISVPGLPSIPSGAYGIEVSSQFDSDHQKKEPKTVLRQWQKRSQSDAAKSDLPSLPLRTQMSRATTQPGKRLTQAQPLSLLLVDDNNVNLRLLEVFAKKAGHLYRTARNGKEAVEVYQVAAGTPDHLDNYSPSDIDHSLPAAPKPDVILMDINMPVMDGFEAAQKIRRFERETNTVKSTIIAITGLGDTSAQNQSVASGMDLFLTKPVKLRELGDVIATLQKSEPLAEGL